MRWRWGGGYGGGEGWGLGMKGRGVAFFFLGMCRHLSHWRFSKVCILLIDPKG